MHQQHTTHHHQQFPHFTHPPPPIEPSLPPIDDSIIEQFLIDRNNLLTNIQTNDQCKVNDGKDRLNVIQMNLNNLIEQQKFEENNLNDNIGQLSPVQWNDKINLLKQNQIKIAELLTKFERLTSESTKSRKKTKKRRTKRKAKKVNEHSTKQETATAAAAKRPKFEGDLEQSYELYEIDRLRTANLKRSAECKRQLTLFDSLIELRSIRRKNSHTSGSDKMASERNFIEKIDQLKSKWNDALVKCNSQENKLKMLSENTTSQLWSNALFSNNESPFADNAMNFKTLLDIR